MVPPEEDSGLLPKESNSENFISTHDAAESAQSGDKDEQILLAGSEPATQSQKPGAEVVEHILQQMPFGPSSASKNKTLMTPSAEPLPEVLPVRTISSPQGESNGLSSQAPIKDDQAPGTPVNKDVFPTSFTEVPDPKPALDSPSPIPPVAEVSSQVGKPSDASSRVPDQSGRSSSPLRQYTNASSQVLVESTSKSGQPVSGVPTATSVTALPDLRPGSDSPPPLMQCTQNSSQNPAKDDIISEQQSQDKPMATSVNVQRDLQSEPSSPSPLQQNTHSSSQGQVHDNQISEEPRNESPMDTSVNALPDLQLGLDSPSPIPQYAQGSSQLPVEDEAAPERSMVEEAMTTSVNALTELQAGPDSPSPLPEYIRIASQVPVKDNPSSGQLINEEPRATTVNELPGPQVQRDSPSLLPQLRQILSETEKPTSPFLQAIPGQDFRSPNPQVAENGAQALDGNKQNSRHVVESEKSHPNINITQSQGIATVKGMKRSELFSPSNDSEDRLADSAAEGLKSLQKGLVYLKKSEASHRHEQNLLRNALDTEVTDTRPRNECEDLRAEKKAASLDRENLEKACAVLKIEKVSMNEELLKVRDETAKSLLMQQAEMAADARKNREVLATIRLNSKEAVSAAQAELVQVKSLLKVCQRDLKKSKAQIQQEKRSVAGKVSQARKEERRIAKETVAKVEKEQKSVADGHIKEIKALEKGKADALARVKKKVLTVSEVRQEAQKSRKAMDRFTRDAQKKQSTLEDLERRVAKEAAAAEEAIVERDELLRRYNQVLGELKAQWTDPGKERHTVEEASENLRKLEDVTRDFTLPPSHLALVSPSPLLRRGKRRAPPAAEDVASESRSQFMDTMPLALQGMNELGEVEGSDNLPVDQRSAKVWKSANKRRRKTRSNMEVDEDSGRSKDVRPVFPSSKDVGDRKDRKLDAKKSKPVRRTSRHTAGTSDAVVVGDKPGEDSVQSDEADQEESTPAATTRSSRRELRSQKRVSYDYDKDGRDIISPPSWLKADAKSPHRSVTRSVQLPGHPPLRETVAKPGRPVVKPPSAKLNPEKKERVQAGRIKKLEPSQRKQTRSMSAALTPRTRSANK